MLGAEEIQRADDDNSKPRKNFRTWQTQVLEGGQSADGSGDQVIGDEEKSADDGNDFGTVPDAGINAAAIGIMAADDHVINAHERGEQGHGGNEPKRGVACDGESEANDVRFAGAPIAVENSRSARPIDVARPFSVTDDHGGGKSERSVRELERKSVPNSKS